MGFAAVKAFNAQADAAASAPPQKISHTPAASRAADSLSSPIPGAEGAARRTGGRGTRRSPRAAGDWRCVFL